MRSEESEKFLVFSNEKNSSLYMYIKSALSNIH